MIVPQLWVSGDSFAFAFGSGLDLVELRLPYCSNDAVQAWIGFSFAASIRGCFVIHCCVLDFSLF